MLLRLYQILLYLIQPATLAYLLLRSRKTPAYRKRLRERYGLCTYQVTSGGILLHSVSVGETLAAIPLVRVLRQHYPSLPIIVTTMTPTGSERVTSAFGDDVYHFYLPYDLPSSMRRFLKKINPILVIIMETELWPSMINQLHQRQVPLILANARLSVRSAENYQKLSFLVKNILSKITMVAAQHQEDGERFIQLGLRRMQLNITGSLKFDISVTPELAASAVTLRNQWAPHRPVWIATSTHEGEEEIVLKSYKKILENFPNLLLILAPRHPERFIIAEKLTQKMGFKFLRRSEGIIPSAEIQVVITDTMGELMLFYGIADLAFVGGSLVEIGGHNPLEAAVHALPVLMGPSTFNFKDICEKLIQADALITVFDSESMSNVIISLLSDENYRLYYGHHAAAVLHENQGALQRLLKILQPYLPQKDQ
ncbi:3-deoxy-D-manno-octulosonic acid transferase [Candidatus Hartigia pinicola]|nr:3-deoxy-D-manno-octulosonic acid transferase [Candidatus Hartigia pinicola]